MSVCFCRPEMSMNRMTCPGRRSCGRSTRRYLCARHSRTYAHSQTHAHAHMQGHSHTRSSTSRYVFPVSKYTRPCARKLIPPPPPPPPPQHTEIALYLIEQGCKLRVQDFDGRSGRSSNTLTLTRCICHARTSHRVS